MESLPQAKTIDLCNNPLTKRPKLDVARELLPEWTVFDERAKQLEDAFLSKHEAAAEASASTHAEL